MRYFLSFFLIAVVCFSSCKKKQEDIADIKKKTAAINGKLSSYKYKSIDDITSAAKGNINGYYRDEEVKKIVAEHFADTSRTFTEYYFDEGMLMYIVSQHYVYNKPMSYTEEKARANNDSVWYDDKKTKLVTDRYFFDQNKLIKWTGPDNNDVPPKTAAFIDKESMLWAEAIILIKQLKEE